MVKIMKPTLMLLIIMITISMIPIYIFADSVITFADPVVEKAVREKINKPTGDILTTDIEMVSQLNLDDLNITSLQGIEFFTNLTSISLDNNYILDLSPLNGLSKLTYVNAFKTTGNLSKILTIQKAAQDILDEIVNREMTDFEKVLAIHDYVARSTSYSEEIPNNDFSAYAVLVYKAGLCGSYSLAMQDLLGMCGIETKYVQGRTQGSSHAWNAVNLNGEWYYVDVLWDDFQSDNARIQYDFFLASATDIKNADVGRTWDSTRHPSCVSEKYSFVRNILDQYDTYDRFDMRVVKGDYIYYSNQSELGSLYKAKIDGTSNVKLTSDSCRNITVTDSKVYYKNASDGKVYEVNLDGTNKQLASNVIKDIQLDNGFLNTAFNPIVNSYTVTLPMGTTVVPNINITTNDENVNVTVDIPSEVPGTATITIKDLLGNVLSTYILTFFVSNEEGLGKVVFADSNIENSVRAYTGIYGRDLIQKDVLEVYNLQLALKGISNMSGIENLKNLKTLTLQSNNLSDISRLTALKNLEMLDISYNSVSDLSPLSELTCLRNLYAASNGINNIEVLEGIQFTELNLSNNNISDLTPLSKISTMTSLGLLGNPISSLEPVVGIPITYLLAYDMCIDTRNIKGSVAYGREIGTNALYKINLQDSSKTVITEDNSDNIVVDEDWIYYDLRTDAYNPYKIRHDGSERRRDDDTLRSIDWYTIGGTLTPNFNKNIFNYTYTSDLMLSSASEIYGTATDIDDSVITVISATTLIGGTATFKVTSKDGLYSNTYTVKILCTPMEEANEAVINAEKSRIQSDIDEARVLVNSIRFTPDKTALLARLDAITPVDEVYLTMLNRAMDSVVIAETSHLQSDVDSARGLIEGLFPEDKVSLEERLKVVEQTIENAYQSQVTLAINAVVKAETTNLVMDVNTATDLVNILKDADKPSLLTRLATVQQIINATQAVVSAEGACNQESVDSALTLVEQLADGAVKTNLISRLNAVQDAIDNETALNQSIKTATDAVVVAESIQTQESVNTAMSLVGSLDEGAVKMDLMDRLDTVQEIINNVTTLNQKLQIATEAVVTAESNHTQALVDSALVLVNALPNCPEKANLLERLEAVQVIINNAYNTQLATATQAVVRAENSKTQQDVDNARILVNQLRVNDKNALNARLDAVQHDMDEESESQEQLATAIEAVELAETSLRQKDVNHARNLVDELENGVTKQALLERISEIQLMIDAPNYPSYYIPSVSQSTPETTSSTNVATEVGIPQGVTIANEVVANANWKTQNDFMQGRRFITAMVADEKERQKLLDRVDAIQAEATVNTLINELASKKLTKQATVNDINPLPGEILGTNTVALVLNTASYIQKAQKFGNDFYITKALVAVNSLTESPIKTALINKIINLTFSPQLKQGDSRVMKGQCISTSSV